MSLLNPGKRGILTVIALMLIVGVPGVIAYADSSDDTYYSERVDSTVPDVLRIYESDTYHTFGVTSVPNGSSITYVIDSTASDETTALSSLTAVTKYRLNNDGANLSSLPDKFVVSTDLSVTAVKILLVESNALLGSFELEYDESTDSYFYELSSVDAATYSDADRFTLELIVDSSEAVDQFDVALSMYDAETVFTDEIVELIVMIGGILLLICGTFALSFIDVDTPGKAVNAAKRGIRSAGNKMRRGKK